MLMLVTETELMMAKMETAVTELKFRKEAIPVPGPIGGGSLSDCKEANDGKDSADSGKWPVDPSHPTATYVKLVHCDLK